MDHRVRRAVSADAAELARFLRARDAEHAAAAHTALAATLANEAGFHCWVLECGYRIVGTMSVLVEAGLKRPRWLIESIHVDASHQGRGLTRLLLDTVRHEARQQKVRHLATLCAPQWHDDDECLLKGRLY